MERRGPRRAFLPRGGFAATFALGPRAGGRRDRRAGRRRRASRQSSRGSIRVRFFLPPRPNMSIPPALTRPMGRPNAPHAGGEPKAGDLRAGKTFAKIGGIVDIQRETAGVNRRRGLALGRNALAKSAAPHQGASAVSEEFGIHAMKVTIERSVLLKALGHVHRIVEKRNTIPILANVLIEAADGKVALKSTDLDLEATESVPADVVQAGATTVRGACDLRHRAQARRRRAGEPRNRRRDRTAASALGPVALLSPGAARLRLPRPHARASSRIVSRCRRWS